MQCNVRVWTAGLGKRFLSMTCNKMQEVSYRTVGRVNKEVKTWSFSLGNTCKVMVEEVKNKKVKNIAQQCVHIDDDKASFVMRWYRPVLDREGKHVSSTYLQHVLLDFKIWGSHSGTY